MEKQIGQLVNVVGNLESQGFVKLHLQAMPSRVNVCAIILRSGKSLGGPKKYIDDLNDEIKVEAKTSLLVIEPSKSSSNITEPIFILHKVNSKPFNSFFTLPPSLPLSSSTSHKKEEQKKKILEMFRKVEINIPLLDAIKHIPRHARFFELCTTKRNEKLKGNKIIIMKENEYAIIYKKIH